MGLPVLVLSTVGRKSGRLRHSPVFFVEEDGAYAVVASNAGSHRTPAWYLNATAAGSADVMLSGRVFPAEVREASAEERERLWPRLDALYEGYERYRGYTDREIPIVLLTPRG